MQQQLGVGSLFEIHLNSGGGEEQSHNQSGCKDKEEEWDHVLDDFDHNPQQHSGAFKEREDRVNFHTLEESEESEKEGLSWVRWRVHHTHHEVKEREQESKHIKPVPQIPQIRTSLLPQLNHLD